MTGLVFWLVKVTASAVAETSPTVMAPKSREGADALSESPASAAAAAPAPPHSGRARASATSRLTPPARRNGRWGGEITRRL